MSADLTIAEAASRCEKNLAESSKRPPGKREGLGKLTAGYGVYYPARKAEHNQGPSERVVSQSP
jgi:hypothetical protein